MQPSEPPEPDVAPQPPPTAETVRLSALSRPAQATIALALGVLSVFALWHLAAVFLYVAPANTVTQGEHGDAIRGYVNPEFEQNWKLFAPNPLQRDDGVQVRADIRRPDGGTETTDWIDLTAMDTEAIRHNPLPSHTEQNQLRRAWSLYRSTHDDDGTPSGTRGRLSEPYMHRLALLRLSRIMDVEHVQRLQLRGTATRVAPPPWSDETWDTATRYEELEWRTVLEADRPAGTRAPAGGGDR